MNDSQHPDVREVYHLRPIDPLAWHYPQRMIAPPTTRPRYVWMAIGAALASPACLTLGFLIGRFL